MARRTHPYFLERMPIDHQPPYLDAELVWYRILFKYEVVRASGAKPAVKASNRQSEMIYIRQGINASM